MSTVIYPSPIFGPVHSRRLGISLGINLLPEGGKWCSFDCIYCECGFNADHRTHNPLPTTEQVSEALEKKLVEMQAEGLKPDVLTFAGNGEPTMNPHFPEVVAEVRRLRDQYAPSARISVLCNSTQVFHERVFQTLLQVDNAIMKLDTVDPEYIRQVDRPTGHLDVDALVSRLAEMGDRCIIQTMFMGGEFEGKDVDNTGERYVGPWLDALRKISPRQVMIYTIDRETPAPLLRKATHEQLDNIAQRVRELGIECSVSY